jgi:hypothetical protein
LPVLSSIPLGEPYTARIPNQNCDLRVEFALRAFCFHPEEKIADDQRQPSLAEIHPDKLIEFEDS